MREFWGRLEIWKMREVINRRLLPRPNIKKHESSFVECFFD